MLTVPVWLLFAGRASSCIRLANGFTPGNLAVVRLSHPQVNNLMFTLTTNVFID